MINSYIFIRRLFLSNQLSIKPSFWELKVESWAIKYNTRKDEIYIVKRWKEWIEL